MDGHFVPNLSFGFPIAESVAKHFPQVKLDVHLMVTDPQNYVDRLADLGVYQISVHWETCPNLHRVLQSIKKRGVRAGVAFNPHTPVEQAETVADLIDCYLMMTVNPGFGGQSFLASQLPKIKVARRLASAQQRHVHVCVDGGVDKDTAPDCVEAGADVLVAGSYLFKADDMESAISSLRGKGSA
jgi:ribulose-phosphate 3-epimerase